MLRIREYRRPGNTQAQTQFLAQENYCVLCQNKLRIWITEYLENYMVIEEAKCDECQIVIRTLKHKIS